MLRLYIIVSVVCTILACYLIRSFNPRARGVGFMSCTHFFNTTAADMLNATSKFDAWDECPEVPKMCGNEGWQDSTSIGRKVAEVNGCDEFNSKRYLF